jgi:hypothetical protein
VLCFVLWQIKWAVTKTRTILEGYGTTVKQVIIFTGLTALGCKI